MFNEKKLVEDRNAKISAMEEIVNKAETENRLPSDEEKAQFNNYKKEVADIDDALEMQKEVQDMNEIKVPGASVDKTAEDKAKVEAAERKTFESALRGIYNNDTNTTVADGQITIPTTIWDRIVENVKQISPIYERADVFHEKGTFIVPADGDGNLEVTYADEFVELEAKNVKIDGITLGGYLAGALVKVSRKLISNSKFDIVEYVTRKLAEKIADFIDKECLNGTTNKITGLTDVDANHTVTAAAQTAFTADEVINVQDKVADKFQENAIWITSLEGRNSLRKLKDGQGNYLLEKDFTAKWGYRLLGRDVYVSENMPKIAAGNTVLYYGDMSGLAINVHEDANIQVLNEKYATQHAVGIVGWTELDAKLADKNKVARLVMAA